MKILGYQISGQTVGTQIQSWGDELGNNRPFIIIEDNESIPSGYTDISSITSWGFWGHEIDPRINLMAIRKEMGKLLTDAQITGDTSTYTADELEEILEHKLDWYFKLYEQFDHLPNETNVQEPPLDINYDLLGLHKKRYFNKGELYKVEYYKSYNFITDVFSNLVLHEARVYHRFNEMVHRRELKICWHLNTEISGATKNTTKYYTQEESFAAGERRRRNCITNLKIGAVGLIMDLSGITQQEAETIGWSFLDEFSSEITVFIEGAEQILKDALLATTNHDWLDGKPSKLGYFYTIREYLYGEINIDYTENNTYI